MVNRTKHENPPRLSLPQKTPQTKNHGLRFSSPETHQAVLQGGCLQGGANFKVEKAHFAARKKGPENRKNEVNLRPPSVPP